MPMTLFNLEPKLWLLILPSLELAVHWRIGIVSGSVPSTLFWVVALGRVKSLLNIMKLSSFLKCIENEKLELLADYL